MNRYGKYEGVINKITLSDATFKNSTEKVIEPSWINYFYGNNGTGKSTIARAIKAGSGLDWNGVQASDYVIRVFSRDFITDELKFADDDPTMPGVITIGKESIAAEGEIKDKQAEQEKLFAQAEADKNEFTRLQAEKAKLDKNFIDSCNVRGTVYRKIFGGGEKEGVGSTKSFADKVKTTTPKEHDFADIKARFEAANDPNARTYDAFASLDLSRLDNAENFPLLAEPIISTSDSEFNRFMQSLGAAKWVEDGYRLYAPKAKVDGKCPYCQQSIEDAGFDINEEIAKCFDGKYAEDCAKLADYQRRYAEYTSSFIATTRQRIEFLKSIPQGFGEIAKYEKNLAQLEKALAENNQKIAAKIDKPSEAVALDTIRPFLEAVNNLIDDTNALFEKNNKIYSNQGKAKAVCLSEIFELSAFELQTVIEQYAADTLEINGKLAAQKTKSENSNNSLNAIKSTLAKLTEKLGGIEATVPKVNDLLIKTGFRGFSLEPHKDVPNRYCVVREDKSPATKLSEGERNFIAFLYFYYLVQGSWKQEELPKGKIVVIDDPVSSMDSGVLATASSLVRELINDCYCDGEKYNIKQIFILTHNPYFHNAVSNEMLRPEEAYFKKVAFFEVKKSEDNISSISEPCTQESRSKDPEITHENYSPVQNSYAALWQEYKDAKLPTTLLHTINRIIEYHFILICSYAREDLRNQIVASVGNDTGKLKLANEILQNVYDSTAVEDSVGEMIYHPAPNSAVDYRAVFREIFKAMGQEQHYAKMSGEG